MSTVKTNNVQVGLSLTSTNNFTWYQPAVVDGTVRLGNGNAGSVTDVLTATSAGNVGIGTSSPAGKVGILYSTNTAYDGGLAVENSNSGSGAVAAFQLTNDAGNRAGAYLTSSNCSYYGGTNTFNLGTVESIPFTFLTANTERMRIDTSGNVLVGTTSASTPSTTGFISTANTFGFKNRIINGAMGIWQRGTSTTTDASYLADRFRVVNITSASQQADAPAGFKYSVQLANSGASFPSLQQRIESVNCIDLVGNSVTVSFWAKNNSGSAYLSAELYYANSVDNFAAITIIGSTFVVSTSPSSSWTYYTTTFTNLPAGAANGLQLVLFRQNQSAATTSYTGVQLEKGSTATSFDYRPYGTELALCQRYLPAWNTSAVNAPFAIGQATSTSVANVILPYQVQPRVPPTGITASAAGTFYLVNNTGGVAGTYVSTAFSYASLNSLWITCNCGSGLTAGNAVILGTNSAPAQILATGCEL